MHRYHVADANVKVHAIALRDSAGRYHVARATADLPALGAELDGAPPRLGFGILLATSTGQVFRLIFEVIDCSEPPPLDRITL